MILDKWELYSLVAISSSPPSEFISYNPLYFKSMNNAKSCVFPLRYVDSLQWIENFNERMRVWGFLFTQIRKIYDEMLKVSNRLDLGHFFDFKSLFFFEIHDFFPLRYVNTLHLQQNLQKQRGNSTFIGILYVNESWFYQEMQE